MYSQEIRKHIIEIPKLSNSSLLARQQDMIAFYIHLFMKYFVRGLNIMKYDEAIEFIYVKYRDSEKIKGEDFFDELSGVANILNEKGYGLEYRVTALFRHLLRDTGARHDEIMDYSSMEVLEAVQLLNRSLECDMYKYINGLSSNVLAHPVHLAEHLYNLLNANSKLPDDIKKLIDSSEKYYISCAQGTNFYEPILKELDKLKFIVNS